MAYNERVQQIQKEIEAIVSKRPEAYIENKERWGEFNFSEVENEIRALYFLLVRLSKLPLIYIPHGYQLEEIASCCQLFNKVENFNVGDTDIADKNALFEEIRNKLTQIFEQNGVFIPILAMFDPGDRDAFDKAIETEKKAKEISENMTSYLSEAKSKVADVLEAIQGAAAEIGVGKYADDFSKQARNFASAAFKWLVLTGIFATVTFGLALGFLFFPVDTPDSLEQVIQFSVSKVVTLGLFFGATVWCGRHFRALKHQESICLHRSNALATFQAFVQAANETSTKEAVLIETTRSIFALSATGFLGNSETSNGDNLKIVEMFRGMATKASE